MRRSALRFPAACLAACLAAAGCRGEGERSAPAADSPAGGMAQAAPEGDAALIANALSAATSEIAEGATVVLRGDGMMRTLREGTNGWTCMPDNPKLPGNMPMCTDGATREWLEAFSALKPPPENRPIGISYLLQGSWFPSVDDPHAAPGPEMQGTHTGPMLMLVNVPRALLAGYPRSAANVGAPFVMYAGTPYEHLMIPVEVSMTSAATPPR